MHYGLIRNFESVVTELASRDHEVFLAAEEQENLGGLRLAQDLATRHPRVHLVQVPSLVGDTAARLSQKLRVTLDYLLNSWPGRSQLDPTRIGAFGFSAGGFTVLTAVGGRPNLRIIPFHCATQPEFVCDVLRAGNSPLLKDNAEAVDAFAADRRIRAVVLAAPGLGFTFANGGLSDVAVPIQLWTGEKDRVTPHASNGAIIQDQLGEQVEAHSVPGASHPSFLVPCRLLQPPALCRDEDGFDRAEFHRRMNADVVAFFDSVLAPKRP